MARIDFDCSQLKKGDYLSPEQCEKLLHTKQGTPAHAFALMNLRQQIERDSVSSGRPLSVRVYRDGLRVNTDGEASPYHGGLIHQGERRMRRHFRKMMALVDTSKLDPQERAKHERELEIAAMKLQRNRTGRA